MQDLIYGSYQGPGQLKRRPPLLETPEAALSLEALQRILGRRSEIGRELCRLAVTLLAETTPYDVGPFPVKKGVQVGLVAFPLCPYWSMSVYNKKFSGPPDRKWCDKKGKEVEVKTCWTCWNRRMRKKVKDDPDWDSWRNSREYQRLREFLDTFDFDSNLEWLRARNGRSVATEKKQVGRGDRQYACMHASSAKWQQQ